MIKCSPKALILTAIVFMLFAACTSDKPPAPGTEDFREQILKDFNALESKLGPDLEDSRPFQEVSKTIEAFIGELIDSDQDIYGVGFLDTSGKYITGYVIDDTVKGKLVKDKYKGMNFHSFKVVEKIIKTGKIMQEKLYLQNTRIFAIGFPVNKDGKVQGIICFSFKSREFEKKWGIGEEQFFNIDFNKN